jgi:drug/metabolite transporter (DMT)-like permease
VSDTETRAERAANLFDLRRIIGGVFVVWGVLLIILGLTDSEEEANKAAGININLWAGLGMLIVGAIFVAWALTRPLGQELAESEEASRSAGGDGQGTRRPGDSGS